MDSARRAEKSHFLATISAPADEFFDLTGRSRSRLGKTRNPLGAIPDCYRDYDYVATDCSGLE